MKLTTTAKPTKAQAFEIVQRYAQNARDRHNNITDYNAAKDFDLLLQYFAPPVPAKVKTPMDWFRKMAALDSNKPWRGLVMADSGRLYTTNGASLAVINTDLPDGIYCAKTLMRVEHNLPDIPPPSMYQQIITRAEEYQDATPQDELEVRDGVYARRVGEYLYNASYAGALLACPSASIRQGAEGMLAVFGEGGAVGALMMMKP